MTKHWMEMTAVTWWESRAQDMTLCHNLAQLLKTRLAYFSYYSATVFSSNFVLLLLHNAAAFLLKYKGGKASGLPSLKTFSFEAMYYLGL